LETDVKVPDTNLFDLSGRCAIVTGGSGALGRCIARGLAAHGATVAVVARDEDRLERVASELREIGPEAIGVHGDVLDRESLEGVRDRVLEVWGRVDILVNAAGGNIDGATVPEGGSFFDLDAEAVRSVVDLNLMGTVLPIQILGPSLAASGHGSIVNISSMAASRSLTRVAGYGAAKAAVENLTRWLAVHAAQKYGSGLRVNAVAPGFFLSEQNRDLLVRGDGSWTARGRAVIAHTPMGRLGEPEDLASTVVWLASVGSCFITGAVIPVDGGFLAFGGV
jgi:NAD(P)-dependent dehydrogenase (short-subunit alcohol dehydrogenase family)